MTKYVLLTDIKDITEMVKRAEKIEGDVVVRKGKFAVDGKSLMGVMSLDLSSGVMIDYPKEEESFDNFLEQFKYFN